MAAAPTPGRTLSFEATLENWAEGLDYTAVPVPPEITETLGTTRAVLVEARVDDSAPFRVSLFPVGGGRHYLRVKGKVRKDAGVGVGDRVRVRFTVLDRSDVTIAPDLAEALEAGGATELFAALTPGRRNFAVRRIDEALRPETRARRIGETVAKLRRPPAGPDTT